MNIARLRSLGFAALFVLFAGAGCHRSEQTTLQPGVSPSPPTLPPKITPSAPDAFYDPPADSARTPGTLLRSEPLRDVVLPPGVRGWRILYATTVDDNTPATAVATVF
ncbi:MAG TPA: hypothetical protein VFA51_04025, partial [Candidatus Udaeobacter sp.]|nr:hypothetical protein [Candidatus Udaeobacter sp.]